MVEGQTFPGSTWSTRSNPAPQPFFAPDYTTLSIGQPSDMSSGSIKASGSVVSIRLVIVMVAVATSGNVVATNVFWSGGMCEGKIHMDSEERVTYCVCVCVCVPVISSEM